MNRRLLRRLVYQVRRHIEKERKFDLRVITNKLFRPHPAEVLKTNKELIELTMDKLRDKQSKEILKNTLSTLRRNVKERTRKERINVTAYKYEIKKILEE
ncbi:MAG: hypothetical protein QXI58_00225 [Candidatus Micrarchaeia archaeon]|jgi:hypothetical protein